MKITIFRVRNFDSQFEINSVFSSKNPQKILRKQKPNPSKIECKKNKFRRRFFRVSASILEPLGPTSPPRCLQRQACYTPQHFMLALTYCISLLGEGGGSKIGGQTWAMLGHVGTMLAQCWLNFPSWAPFFRTRSLLERFLDFFCSC